MENEIAIEVSSVTRRFGSLTAVDDLSFKVGKGEIFGLLGTKWGWQNDNHQPDPGLAESPARENSGAWL